MKAHTDSCMDLREFLTKVYMDSAQPYLQPFIFFSRAINPRERLEFDLPLWLEISQQPGVHVFPGMSKSPHQTLSEYLQLPDASVAIDGKRYRTSLARAEDYAGGTLAFMALDDGYLWTCVPKELL